MSEPNAVSDVNVCVSSSPFTNVTVCPAPTWMVAGVKASCLIVTVATFGAAVACAPTGAPGPNAASTKAPAARAVSDFMTRLRRRDADGSTSR